MQKIPENQIEKLYKFTRQHFLEWYDVQTELVDHLANGVEQQWDTKPNLSFDEALNFDLYAATELYIGVISVLLTCFIMLNYIVVFVLPSKVYELLEKQYPEYNLQVKV